MRQIAHSRIFHLSFEYILIAIFIWHTIGNTTTCDLGGQGEVQTINLTIPGIFLMGEECALETES